jgi:hypothetical protein
MLESVNNNTNRFLNSMETLSATIALTVILVILSFLDLIALKIVLSTLTIGLFFTVGVFFTELFFVLKSEYKRLF